MIQGGRTLHKTNSIRIQNSSKIFCLERWTGFIKLMAPLKRICWYSDPYSYIFFFIIIIMVFIHVQPQDHRISASSSQFLCQIVCSICCLYLPKTKKFPNFVSPAISLMCVVVVYLKIKRVATFELFQVLPKL